MYREEFDSYALDSTISTHLWIQRIGYEQNPSGSAFYPVRRGMRGVFCCAEVYEIGANGDVGRWNNCQNRSCPARHWATMMGEICKVTAQALP